MTRISPSKGFAQARYAWLELHIDREAHFGTSQDLVALFRSTGMHRAAVETFYALAYGPDLNIATIFEVNRGFYGHVDLNIPAVLGGVMVAGVDRFVLAHNHPSNNPLPSEADLELNREMMKAANVARLYYEDHLILTPTGKHFSLTASGLLIPAKDSPYYDATIKPVRAAARHRHR